MGKLLSWQGGALLTLLMSVSAPAAMAPAYASGLAIAPNKPLFSVPVERTSPGAPEAIQHVAPAVTQHVAPAQAVVPAQEVAPQPAATPAATPVQRWTLRPGRLVQDELQAWAATTHSSGNGWSFIWKVDRGWVVPAESTFTGSFDQAAEAVIRALYEQGKPVRAEIWEGNRIFEVLHVDAR